MRSGAASIETVQGCLETRPSLSLQDKILNADRLGLGGILLNSIPGDFLIGSLNRRLEETLDPLSLLLLRVLGLEEGCLLLLDILNPRVDRNWLQGQLDLCTPGSMRQCRIR